jgi:hypothetical protein
VTAIATVTALQKACDNKDLTRQGVLDAMQNLQIDYKGITPPVDMGNGSSIVSYNSRMNSIDPDTGADVPIGDFVASDVAKAWGKSKGF